jgi:hypothetical protein
MTGRVTGRSRIKKYKGHGSAPDTYKGGEKRAPPLQFSKCSSAIIVASLDILTPSALILRRNN